MDEGRFRCCNDLQAMGASTKTELGVDAIDEVVLTKPAQALPGRYRMKGPGGDDGRHWPIGVSRGRGGPRWVNDCRTDGGHTFAAGMLREGSRCGIHEVGEWRGILVQCQGPAEAALLGTS